MALEEAAFHSCRVVLQRRNEGVGLLEGIVQLLRQHAAALEGIVKDREDRIASLSQNWVVRLARRLKWPPGLD